MGRASTDGQGREPAAEAVSQRWHIVAVAFFLLATVVNLWDWLVGQRMPLGDFPGFVAGLEAVRDALLEHGRVPRWCTGCYGGTSVFTTSFREIVFSPLAVAVDPVLATKLAFAFLKCLSALSFYIVVVRVLAAPAVGLVAGYAFGFGAVANHQNQHMDVVLASVLVAWIFLAAHELLRQARLRWAVVLGVVGALQFVNNWVHALPAPFMVLVLMLVRPWPASSNSFMWVRDRRTAGRWIALGGVAVGLSLTLAASQLTWIWSDTWNHRLIPSDAIETLRDLNVERSPFLFLNRDNWLGDWLSNHHPPGYDRIAQHGERRYLGGVVLVVCIAGLLAGRKDARLNRLARVAGLIFLFQYWLSLGPKTLLWQIGESLHWGHEAQPVVARALRFVAAASALLGIGLVWWKRRAPLDARRTACPLSAAVGVGLLCFFPTASLWSGLAWALPMLEVQRSPGHYFDTAPFWLCLLFSVSLVTLLRRLPAGAGSRTALVAVLAVVVLDYWPSRHQYSKGMPLRSLRDEARVIEVLAGADDSVRLVLAPAYSPLSSWVAAQAPTGHAWGWLGWQSGRFWNPFLAEAAWRTVPTRTSDGRVAERANSALLAAARIRYFLLDPQARAVYSLPPPWRLLRKGKRFSVWEQPDMLPMVTGYRDYAVLEDTAVGDEEPLDPLALATRAQPQQVLILSPRKEQRDLVSLRRGARWLLAADGSKLPAELAAEPVSPGHVQGPGRSGELSPSGADPVSATYLRVRPEQIISHVEAGPGPAMLLISESYHPWWQARVDGRSAPVLRAQGALMAVPVGPGVHQLKLQFMRPTAVFCADWLTKLAWSGLVLVLMREAARWVRCRARARASA